MLPSRPARFSAFLLLVLGPLGSAWALGKAAGDGYPVRVQLLEFVQYSFRPPSDERVLVDATMVVPGDDSAHQLIKPFDEGRSGIRIDAGLSLGPAAPAGFPGRWIPCSATLFLEGSRRWLQCLDHAIVTTDGHFSITTAVVMLLPRDADSWRVLRLTLSPLSADQDTTPLFPDRHELALMHPLRPEPPAQGSSAASEGLPVRMQVVETRWPQQGRPADPQGVLDATVLFPTDDAVREYKKTFDGGKSHLLIAAGRSGGTQPPAGFPHDWISSLLKLQSDDAICLGRGKGILTSDGQFFLRQTLRYAARSPDRGFRVLEATATATEP